MKSRRPDVTDGDTDRLPSDLSGAAEVLGVDAASEDSFDPASEGVPHAEAFEAGKESAEESEVSLGAHSADRRWEAFASRDLA
eukprot:scaffold97_cov261-Pinguiococcus_pyrenoidosus.AAC.26